jgi:hypothetical protein
MKMNNYCYLLRRHYWGAISNLREITDRYMYTCVRVYIYVCIYMKCQVYINIDIYELYIYGPIPHMFCIKQNPEKKSGGSNGRIEQVIGS